MQIIWFKQIKLNRQGRQLLLNSIGKYNTRFIFYHKLYVLWFIMELVSSFQHGLFCAFVKHLVGYIACMFGRIMLCFICEHYSHFNMSTWSASFPWGITYVKRLAKNIKIVLLHKFQLGCGLSICPSLNHSFQKTQCDTCNILDNENNLHVWLKS